MLGREFVCAKCGYGYLAGITHFYTCSKLPEATLFVTGDNNGFWIIRGYALVKNGEEEYCGVCAEKEFPQILDADNVKTWAGSAAF